MEYEDSTEFLKNIFNGESIFTPKNTKLIKKDIEITKDGYIIAKPEEEDEV